MYQYDLEYFFISQMDRTSPKSSNMELAKYNYCAYGKIIMYVKNVFLFFFVKKLALKNFCFIFKDLYHTF